MQNIDILIGMTIGFVTLIITMFLNSKSGVSKLSDKIDFVAKELREKIETLDAKIDTKIDALENKLSNRIKMIENKLSDKIDVVVSEVSNLAQRVTALEVVRTGSASIPALTLSSPQKATNKTETKSTTEPTHKIPQTA